MNYALHFLKRIVIGLTFKLRGKDKRMKVAKEISPTDMDYTVSNMEMSEISGTHFLNGTKIIIDTRASRENNFSGCETCSNVEWTISVLIQI